ncbi:hypothetical protein LF1_13770 [Rubripirellula obstinata]|uniref:Uncharacterized protein n=1 Tax=Rubripirellula obstinata TaxID=406547 RepID=A0A5B1CH53_9BACT|nr:hypothetical protein LF1_13770 [Rubripirellula obstinata]
MSDDTNPAVINTTPPEFQLRKATLIPRSFLVRLAALGIAPRVPVPHDARGDAQRG